MKIKNKISKVICTVALLSTLGATNVLAANYTAYVLPARQGNNYTTQHEKKTTDAFLNNTVTAVEGTSTVTFWVANSNSKQISDDYKQKLHNKSKIKFTTKGYNKKGKEVMLGMENSN